MNDQIRILAVPSTRNVAAAKCKENKASTEGGGSCGEGLIDNGVKKSSLSFIPPQVLMNCSTDNIKTRLASDSSKMLNTENPESCIDDNQNWSPLMDGIVTRIPRSLIANCSLSNGTLTEPKDPKKLNRGLALKAVDEYIDKVLYGPKKNSSLPVFEKIHSECLAED